MSDKNVTLPGLGEASLPWGEYAISNPKFSSSSNEELFNAFLSNDPVELEKHAVFALAVKDRELLNLMLLNLLARPAIPWKCLSYWASHCTDENWMRNLFKTADKYGLGVALDYPRLTSWWMSLDLSLNQKRDCLFKMVEGELDKLEEGLAKPSSSFSSQVAERVHSAFTSCKGLSGNILKVSDTSKIMLLSISDARFFSLTNFLSKEALAKKLLFNCSSFEDEHGFWLCMTKNPSELAPRFFSWLDSSDKNKSAYLQALAFNDEAVNLAMAWIEKWLPSGSFKNSPLSTALNNPSPSKNDHPFSDPLWGEVFSVKAVNLNVFLNQKLRTFIATLRDRSISDLMGKISFIAHEIADNPHLGTAIKSSPAYHLGVCPPDLLSSGMLFGSSWINKLATDAAAAPSLESALRDPRNQKNIVANRSVLEVIRWIEDRPIWKDWRDHDGNNLLHVFTGGDSRRHLTMSSLLKLHQLAPELLTEKNRFGDAVISGLGWLPDDRRAKVRKISLANYNKQTPVKKTVSFKM